MFRQSSVPGELLPNVLPAGMQIEFFRGNLIVATAMYHQIAIVIT